MQRWRRPQREARRIIGYAAISIGLVVLVVGAVSQGWSTAWFGALGGFWLFFLWRHARSGIYVSGSGIRVVRFLGSEVLPWDQLVAVEVSSSEHAQILLHTTSGAVVRTEVYRGTTGRRNDVWLRPNIFDRLIARLRELHEQAQQDGPDSHL